MKMGESYPNGEKTLRENGEIARYEQFLLFPQCFQDLYCKHIKNQGLFGKSLKHIIITSFNTLPNHKIINMTKLKAFPNDKSDVAIMKITLLDWVENTVEKGENAGYQHFLLFPVFSKAILLRVVKSRNSAVKQ